MLEKQQTIQKPIRIKKEIKKGKVFAFFGVEKSNNYVTKKNEKPEKKGLKHARKTSKTISKKTSKKISKRKRK